MLSFLQSVLAERTRRGSTPLQRLWQQVLRQYLSALPYESCYTLFPQMLARPCTKARGCRAKCLCRYLVKGTLEGYKPGQKSRAGGKRGKKGKSYSSKYDGYQPSDNPRKRSRCGFTSQLVLLRSSSMMPSSPPVKWLVPSVEACITERVR